MVKKTLVSVIIPVFNTPAPFLRQCLSSISSQTYTNIEILLVDDGSDAPTASLCDELALLDQRIIVIHKKNGGVSSARNIALARSSGHYITFVDSDDWVDNNFIETLTTAMETQTSQITVCGLYIEYPNKIQRIASEDESITRMSRNEFYHSMLLSPQVGGFLCNKIFRRNLIFHSFDESLHYCEDFVFCATYTKNIQSATIVNKSLYHYRHGHDNASSNLSFNRKTISLLEAYQQIRRIYEIENKSDLIYIDRNLFKQALNLKARYKLCHIHNSIELKQVTDITTRFRYVLFSCDLSWKDKANMWFTWLLPVFSFKLKRKFNLKIR